MSSTFHIEIFEKFSTRVLKAQNSYFSDVQNNAILDIRKMWNLQIAMSKISSDRQMIILRRKEAKNPKESCQCRNNLKEYTREFEIKNVIVLSAYLNHSSIV